MRVRAPALLALAAPPIPRCANARCYAHATCSASWFGGAKAFLMGDRRAKSMADYYGEPIRSGKLDGYCRA